MLGFLLKVPIFAEKKKVIMTKFINPFTDIGFKRMAKGEYA